MLITNNKYQKKEINQTQIEIIKNKLILNLPITIEEEQLFITNEIQNTLDQITKQFQIDAYNHPLTNKCDCAQYILGHNMQKLNIQVYPKETHKTISPTSPGHSFLIIKMPNKTYLVDPTYCQFFQKENCTNTNFIIYENMILKSPDPGYYITQSKEGLTIAKQIIQNGYIELTPLVAKEYCDSFYYSKQGTIIENGKIPKSNITEDIYLNTLLKPATEYSLTKERYEELYSQKRK